MKLNQIKNFIESIKEISLLFKHLSFQHATIIHHNDSDGIASGAILKKALEREGFHPENIPIEKLHPFFLKKLHQPHRKLLIYADLGEQVSTEIQKRREKDVWIIILDHHPPLEEMDSGLIHINPERFDIDGDFNCSASTVAYLFAKALNEKNRDLSYLAVIGACGDHQWVEGRLTGLNQLALEEAIRLGVIQPLRENPTLYGFPLFNNDQGTKIAQFLSELSVNGYYRRGADLAIQACMEGYTSTSLRFAQEMYQIQHERFQKEKRILKESGISSEGEIQWVDVENRFYPLSLKAIGLFCDEICEMDWIHPERYIVGFQDFPHENPYLGRFDRDEVKVSMRVPFKLRSLIEKRVKPDLTMILPQATKEVRGFAEGCHRYAASSIISKNKKRNLIQALSREIQKWANASPTHSPLTI